VPAGCVANRSGECARPRAGSTTARRACNAGQPSRAASASSAARNSALPSGKVAMPPVSARR
jgi:hypothetical protein